MIYINHRYRYEEGVLTFDVNLTIIPSCSEKCDIINGHAYVYAFSLQDKYMFRAETTLRCLSLG